jgi:hypothetical protein
MTRDELSEKIITAIGCAHSHGSVGENGLMSEFYKKKANEIVIEILAENDRLNAELKEYEKLLELQRTRTVEADKRFMTAKNVEYFPDLGELLAWLMGENDRLTELQKHTEKRNSELYKELEETQCERNVALSAYDDLTELHRMHTPDEVPPIFDDGREFSYNVLLETVNGDYYQAAYSLNEKRFYNVSGNKETRMFYNPFRKAHVKGWYFLPGSEVPNGQK